MNKRKFPVTVSELVAIIALLVVAAVAVIGRQAIFSPGSLNAQASPSPQTTLGDVYSHAELAGECSACHAPPWSSDSMAERCLKCHVNIEKEFENPHDLHSMAVQSDKTLTCLGGCHTDHNGSLAAMTLVKGEHFANNPSGFSLKGHQTNANGRPFVCMDCHQTALDKFDLNTCTTCHRDIDAAFTAAHLAEFGRDCMKCHDGLDTYGKAFDHNKMTFPLEGKHTSILCGDCHQGARTASDLKNAPVDCYSCHKQDDQHKGSLGPDCVLCHDASDWKKVTLDHSLTAYPLTGKHITVLCASCHVNNVFKGIPIDCYSCHKNDDQHKGSLGKDCAQCHDTTDWKEATLDHSLTAYPLTGKHTTVLCASCHLNSVFKGIPTDCYSCHKTKDKHLGSLGTDCVQCHNTTDWRQATIDHTKTAYPLTGKHITVLCASCHLNGVFKGTPKDCYSCHKSKDKHLGSLGTNCAQCHNTTDWRQAAINHNLTAFPLTGRHTAVPCASCHLNGVYKGSPKDCYSCHRNNDEHRGRNGTDCARCHSTRTWDR